MNLPAGQLGCLDRPSIPSLFSGIANSMPESGVHVAIDLGLSNTDAVAYIDGAWRWWTQPSKERPDPELVREILATGGFKLSSLERLAVTGGRHRLLPERIDECAVVGVHEVQAIGRGGQALAELMTSNAHDAFLVVSAGSGTAVVQAQGDRFIHRTGTGVGGGTLLGLSRLLLGTVDHHEIDALAQRGDPNGADLALGDVVSGSIGRLPPEATAVNFGKLASRDLAVCCEDLASALVTLVGQVIAVIAINAARAQQIPCIVVTGHLIDMPSMRSVFERVAAIYDACILLPSGSGFATAIGALLQAAASPSSGVGKEGA